MKIIPLLPLALAMCVGCQVTQTYNSNMPSKGKPTESTVKDVEELINFYNEAFIAKEYSKIVGITEVPFVLVNNSIQILALFCTGDVSAYTNGYKSK
jgi:hypothetical protein